MSANIRKSVLLRVTPADRNQKGSGISNRLLWQRNSDSKAGLTRGLAERENPRGVLQNVSDQISSPSSPFRLSLLSASRYTSAREDFQCCDRARSLVSCSPWPRSHVRPWRRAIRRSIARIGTNALKL